MRNNRHDRVPPSQDGSNYNSYSRSNYSRSSGSSVNPARPQRSQGPTRRRTGDTSSARQQDQYGQASSRRSASTPGDRQQNIANERYRHAYQNRSATASGDASAYRDYRNYRAPQKKKRSPRRIIVTLVIVLAVIAIAVLGVTVYIQNLPITITLNGNETELSGTKDIDDAIETLEMTGVILKEGDLVAVDGSVLEAGKGEPFTATVNDKATTDREQKLENGDVVELSNGGPKEEASDSTEEPIAYETRIDGTGAIHLIEGDGKDGVKTIKTGKTSGLTAEETTTDPSDIVLKAVEADPGKDKVVALTFDDGPWPDTTEQILDILKENDVKATFFTVGNCIDDSRTPLVKREYDEGNEVCTHSWDHAEGSGEGVNLTYMSADEQVDEIQKGYDAIEKATGKKPSTIVRFPGGNLDEQLIENVHSLVSADINWDIDTEDWKMPGVSSIVSQIESAQPGDIILMHDGGGDRSQTVEALKEAIPYLKEKGYKFVTISELLDKYTDYKKK